MKYSYSINKYPIKAEIIAKELNKIEKLTPQNVLNAAKKKENPLNKCFEWNDTIAANKYRLEEARCLIQGVIIIDETNKEIKPIRAYVSVEENQRYKPLNKLNDLDIDYVIKSAYNELEQFRNKYNKFKQLKEIIKTINQIINQWK